jgi:hypothetical protein
MDIKDINKGLVVYDNTNVHGLLVVDCVLDDGRVSCNDGHVITYANLLDKVDKAMLDDRRVTQADLDVRRAHI